MSVRPEELRIGNLIQADNSHKWVEAFRGMIVSVDLDTLKTVSYPSSIEGRYNPIPITEEWLLAFGFFKGNQFPYIDGATGWFCLEVNSGFYKLALPSDNIGKQFEYVHQLQNLYFALTGNELTVANMSKNSPKDK